MRLPGQDAVTIENHQTESLHSLTAANTLGSAPVYRGRDRGAAMSECTRFRLRASSQLGRPDSGIVRAI